jgi:hypothetical protein
MAASSSRSEKRSRSSSRTRSVRDERSSRDSHRDHREHDRERERSPPRSSIADDRRSLRYDEDDRRSSRGGYDRHDEERREDRDYRDRDRDERQHDRRNSVSSVDRDRRVSPVASTTGASSGSLLNRILPLDETSQLSESNGSGHDPYATHLRNGAAMRPMVPKGKPNNWRIQVFITLPPFGLGSERCGTTCH